MTTEIDTSPAALKALADDALCNTAFVPKSLLLAIAAEKEAQAKQEPLFFLHCGDVYGNEQDEWEVEVNRQHVVDEITAKFPGKALPLYLAPQHHPEQHLEMAAPADVPQTKLAPHTYSQDMKPPIHAQPMKPEWKMEDPARFAAPADVPLPEPAVRMVEDNNGESVYPAFWDESQMHQYAEAYAKAAVAAERERCLRIVRSVDNYSNPMTADDCADLIEMKGTM